MEDLMTDDHAVDADTPIKILLVDDQPMTQTLVRRMLCAENGQGMVLYHVQDPLMAEARAQEIQPTVILLDLTMPGIDGLELLQRFRAQAVTENVPIVMLSAVDEPQKKAAAFALGANDYVIKLPDPVEMLARLRHHGNARLAQMALKQHLDHLEERVQERTSELTKSLAENKEQEAYLLAILENALDAIISIDVQGLVVEFNPAAERLFGYSKAEAIGQRLDTLIIPPEFCQQHNSALARYTAPIGAPHTLQRRVALPGQCKDGKRVALEAALVMIYRHGKPYFTGFLHDDTDRQQLLKSLQETLTVAQAASRVKSEFIANMSHEMRTPMNAIMAFTKLALQNELPTKLRNDLQKVQSASHTLMGIISNVLDFSQIESGILELRPVEFVLADLLDELAALFEKQVADKEIELLFALPEDFQYALFGDAQRLKQILIHLIGNAIKFTERGRVDVGVEADEPQSDQGWLTFAIHDTGVGMDLDRLTHLFDPFVQADGSATRTYGGVGLGLTLAKELVERMGGRIWAKSVVGEGSVFYFTVRLEYRGQKESTVFLCPIANPAIKPPSTTKVLPEDEQIRPLLTDLAGKLAACSLETDALLVAMNERLQGTSAEPVLRVLERQVEQYEFKKALDSLERLADTLGVS